MDRKFEQAINGESLGIPKDLFSDPGRYDKQIPLWKRTVGFVRQYETARPKGREVLLEQWANTILANPQKCGFLVNNLVLFQQIKPETDFEELQEMILRKVEQQLERNSSLQKWDAAKIGQLIQLQLDSPPPLAAVYARIESALFNAPKNFHEAIDLQYQACWAMVTSTNEDVTKELVSILCYERDVFTPSSFSAFLFMWSHVFSDDAHIEKRFAVVDTINSVAKSMEKPFDSNKRMADRLKARYKAEQSYEAQGDEEIKRDQMLSNSIGKNPDRAKQLLECFQQDIYELAGIKGFHIIEAHYGDYEGGKKLRQELEQKSRSLPWPLCLAFRLDEPLNAYVNNNVIPKMAKAAGEEFIISCKNKGYAMLTERAIPVADDTELQVLGKGYESVEQKNWLVRTVYDALLGTRIDPAFAQPLGQLSNAIEAIGGRNELLLALGDLNALLVLSPRILPEQYGRLVSILQYHRPLIPMERVQAITQSLSQIRHEISTNFVRAIGKRGYELRITDPSLISHGYRSITFRKKDSNVTEVKLEISGQNYYFGIDNNLRTIFGQDVKRFHSIQDQSWLELLTLSHLKRLVCTGEEEEELKSELLGGERQYEQYRKQIFQRSEHLRRLPRGWNYSTDAFNRCLESNFPINNLFLINELRARGSLGGTKETGIWTYVKGTDYVEMPDTKPVKVAFRRASDDIRKAINLGEISREEAARIEQEILRELEAA